MERFATLGRLVLFSLERVGTDGAPRATSVRMHVNPGPNKDEVESGKAR
jgi:hypothetical protein